MLPVTVFPFSVSCTRLLIKSSLKAVCFIIIFKSCLAIQYLWTVAIVLLYPGFIVIDPELRPEIKHTVAVIHWGETINVRGFQKADNVKSVSILTLRKTFTCSRKKSNSESITMVKNDLLAGRFSEQSPEFLPGSSHLKQAVTVETDGWPWLDVLFPWVIFVWTE